MTVQKTKNQSLNFSSGQYLIPDNFDLFSLRVLARVKDITRVVKDSTMGSLSPPQTNETLLVNVLASVKDYNNGRKVEFPYVSLHTF